MARSRRRRSRSTRPEGDGEERTYSIWPIAIVFVLIGAIGLGALLLKGSPSTPTETIPAFTTTTGPAGVGDDPADQSTTGSSTTAAPVTVPGGGPAPEGVTDVLVSGGVTTFAFAVPESFETVPSVAAVARATVAVTADDSGLEISTSCAASDEEALAQVAVTITPSSVTVLPVVVAPSDGPPCAGQETTRQVVLPLGQPVAGRPITVVPFGTAIPPPGD